MTNPDVTQQEDITAWKWIAAATLLVALVAAVVLGDKGWQVASVDPTALPPMVYSAPRT